MYNDGEWACIYKCTPRLDNSNIYWMQTIKHKKPLKINEHFCFCSCHYRKLVFTKI